MPHVAGKMLAPASLAVLEILREAELRGEAAVPRKVLGAALAARGVAGQGRKGAGRGSFGNHTLWNLQAGGFVARINQEGAACWQLAARGRDALEVRQREKAREELPAPTIRRKACGVAPGPRERSAATKAVPEPAAGCAVRTAVARIRYSSGHVLVPLVARSVFEWGMAPELINHERSSS